MLKNIDNIILNIRIEIKTHLFRIVLLLTA